MRKMTFKRFLSGFLAVLMLLTMAPVTAFSGTGDAAQLADLKDAITAYENKMNGDILTNMAPAYSAYIKAKASADSYIYGSDKGVLSTAKTNLETATAAMQPWESPKGNANNVNFGNPGSGQYSASAYCANLLYTFDHYKNDNQGSVFNRANTAYRKVYYNITVMLYDGETTPQLPIMMSSWRSGAHYLWSAYPVADTGNTAKHAALTLPDKWYGANATTTPNFGGNITPSQGQTVGFDQTSATSASVTLSSGIRYFSNYLQYKGGDGQFKTGDNEYSISYTPDWYSNGSSSTTNSGAYDSTKVPIYVVNYKALLTALNSKKSVLANVKDYGDISALLGTIESATSFNPNDSFMSVSGITLTPSDSSTTNTGPITAVNTGTLVTAVNTCATDIKTHVNNITNAATPASSGSAYNDLRDALELTKESFEYGQNGYNNDSWNAFAGAYNLAVDAIDNTVTNGYVATYGADNKTIAEIANDLTAKLGELEMDDSWANTAELKIACASANTILTTYKDYLVSSSALQAAFDAAKVVFSNGNYLLPTVYRDSQQDEVNAFTAAINAALENLTISTTRLENGISAAEGFDTSDSLDPAALTRSLHEARQKLQDAKDAAFTKDNAVSLLKNYVDACIDIERALVYAKTPYGMQTDGVITEASYDSASIKYNLNGNNNNTATFTYPKGVVLVKTTSGAKRYSNIGTYKFDMAASTDSWHAYSQLIYELGITDDVRDDVSSSSALPSTNPFTKGQLSYNNFELTGFTGDIYDYGSGETENSGMYYRPGIDVTTKPSSVNEGLADGGAGTYWWTKQNSYSHSSPVAFTAPMHEISTSPTLQKYEVKRSYIYAYSNQRNAIGIQYPAYDTRSTDTPIDVTVVDISSLCSYQKDAEALAATHNATGSLLYTASSILTLSDAISAAKLLTNDGAIYSYDTAVYQAECVTAYNNLKNAISSLQLATYTATFNYKDANGADAHEEVSGNYNDPITVPSGIPTGYTSGDYRYEFSGWGAVIPATFLRNSVFTATYTQTFIPADYSALDGVRANVWAVISAGRHDYYVPETYNAMVELYDSVSDEAYDNGAYKLGITNQTVIDGYTSSLQTAYNALYVKNQFMVTFEVYVDGDPYDKSVTPKDVRSTVKLTSSYTTGTATWTVNGVDVPNIGYEYSFIVTRDTTVVCDITTTEPTVETTKIIVQDAYGNTYAEYNVSSAMTINDLLANADAPTVAYHERIGWTVNDINLISIADSTVSQVAVDGEIKLRPQYESTREDFVFDKKEKLENKEEDFLCWVLPVDANTYRVVSYSEEYLYFTTGVGGPEAVTEANFSSYQGKLQGVTLEMIDAKVPIPSMRGIAEDDTSANGAYWDKETKQLRIISQFTDGYDDSKYEIVNCGVKLARNGSSTITTALNTTVSNQFIVYYSFSSMTAEEGARTYQVQSWVEYKDKVSGDITRTYSPVANVEFSL